MKNYLAALLGFAAAVVHGGGTSCVDGTVAAIISSNMTAGMALMANATALISSTCNASDVITCSSSESDVVSILADLYSGSQHLKWALDEFFELSGITPSPCPNTQLTDCNCTNTTETWNLAADIYANQYLPLWNQYVAGSVSDCPATLLDLQALSRELHCASKDIARAYELCRYNCRLPCCDDAFATQLNDTMIGAINLVNNAQASSSELCAGGAYTCNATASIQVIKDLQEADNLVSQAMAGMENLYGVDYTVNKPCKIVYVCDCSANAQTYISLNQTYTVLLEKLELFSSGSSKDCGTDLESLFQSSSNIQCFIRQLIANYEKCSETCSCVTSSTQGNITDSMTQAMDAINLVQTAYNAQCPGRFNCSAANLTLVQDDLNSAISFFDSAIGTYSTILKDPDFNSTCSLLKPECSCRVLSDQLILLNATYNLDYLPEWQRYITKNVSDCTTQAELLRGYVLEMKCIAEDLHQDYGLCYQHCQTNWCLVYNCSNKPCGTGTSGPFVPRRSRWLRNLVY